MQAFYPDQIVFTKTDSWHVADVGKRYWPREHFVSEVDGTEHELIRFGKDRWKSPRLVAELPGKPTHKPSVVRVFERDDPRIATEIKEFRPSFVYCLWDERNTWGGPFEYWSKSSSEKLGAFGFDVSVDRLKAVAEKQRRQGSHWKITRVPAIAVLAQKQRLLFVYLETEFWKGAKSIWNLRLYKELPLKTVEHAIGLFSGPCLRPKRLVVLDIGTNAWPAAGDSLKKLTLDSASLGSDRSLAWRVEGQKRWSLRTFTSLVAYLNSRLK